MCFIPRYINCSNWNSDFDKFKKCILDAQEEMFCVIGDLNARTGTEQQLEPDVLSNLPLISPCRNSCDKVVDRNGRRLLELFEDVGGIIVNGRAQGDMDGNFTFVGAQGTSVIDYVCCSKNMLQFISNLSVCCKPYSDHLPIILKISTTHEETGATCELPGKLLWRMSQRRSYEIKIDQLVNVRAYEMINDINDKINHLKSKIVASSSSKVSSTRFEPKTDWFDAQCFYARKKIKNQIHRC